METRRFSRAQASIEILGIDAFPVQNCKVSIRPIEAYRLALRTYYRCLAQVKSHHNGACDGCMFNNSDDNPLEVMEASGEVGMEGEIPGFIIEPRLWFNARKTPLKAGFLKVFIN